MEQEWTALLADNRRPVYVQSDGAYPRVVLHRAHWGGQGSEVPQLGIGISWNGSKVSFAGGQPPFVGVWARTNTQAAQDLERRVATAAAESRKANGYLVEQGWPAWNYCEPPNPDFIDDLGPYRELIVSDTSAAWNLFASLVDAALLPLS